MSFYDDQNIFAQILKGMIPCDLIIKSSFTWIIKDRYPQAPIHELVLPTGCYEDFEHFLREASQEEKFDFWTTVQQRITDLKKKGYHTQVLSRSGKESGQEIFHCHMHIMGFPEA
jgi:diadenosine tetraphosphate (Ap4A) HIT family hydrolase